MGGLSFKFWPYLLTFKVSFMQTCFVLGMLFAQLALEHEPARTTDKGQNLRVVCGFRLGFVDRARWAKCPGRCRWGKSPPRPPCRAWARALVQSLCPPAPAGLSCRYSPCGPCRCSGQGLRSHSAIRVHLPPSSQAQPPATLLGWCRQPPYALHCCKGLIPWQ